MARLKNQVNGSNRIEAADVQVLGPTIDPRYTDDGAVSLVIQDAERARTFIDQKQWNLYWRESDVLLKPNVAYIAQHLSSPRSTEDLIELALRKAERLNFRGIRINNRWAAMAVLAGLS